MREHSSSRRYEKLKSGLNNEGAKLLLEKVERLQTILTSRAQFKHQETDELEYRELRSELMDVPSLREKLPRFVRTCRSFSEFWDLIKRSDLPTYASRRTFITDEFAKIFDQLEGKTQVHPALLTTEQSSSPNPVHSAAEDSAEAAPATHSPLVSADRTFRSLDSTDAARSGASVLTPIDIFFSYAHEDEGLMNDVRRQLAVFQRQGLIMKWHDREIVAGKEWKGEIDSHLDIAGVILLFVSPHFLDSDYCYDAEMKRALERHADGEAIVIPVILRPCLWNSTPFSKLQALPTDAVPITLWPDRDLACAEVAKGVMRVVKELREPRCRK